MTSIIKITGKPTYDITDIQITDFDSGNYLCFFKSKYIFRFENVFGNLENRSRVLRTGKEESRYVESVISASIDAGFCGFLVWKTKLTKEGGSLLSEASDWKQVENKFSHCQQLHLFPSPAGNYYSGTNQTDFDPDVIFTL
jgi:hypothetical protein